MSPSKEDAKKKKALKATWDDSSASEEEEPTNTEQVAHYALMAIGDEVSNSIDANLSFDELLSVFHA